MPSALVELLRDDEESTTLEVVKAYVKKNPKSVKEKDEETGRIPLHDAVDPVYDEEDSVLLGFVSLEIVSFLINAYPKGISEEDNGGRLPLHIAAASEVDTPLYLRILLEAFPVAGQIRDSKGYLPVHCAIISSNFETATLLIGNLVSTRTVDMVNESVEGVTPILHMALEFDAPDDFVQLLLQQIPQYASTLDKEGRFPLHSAVFHAASVEQVDLIRNAHPAAVRHHDKDGNLPLHVETSNEARHEVLGRLLADYPEGARIVNADGSLPIHSAMLNASITVESLELLHQAHPPGLFAVDKSGDTLLHYACHISNKEVLDTVVAWVLEKIPLLAQAMNEAGGLPLHNAAGHPHCTMRVLELLIEKYPRALQTHGEDGDLPLHYSVCLNVEGSEGRGPPAENIQLILEKYPTAASMVNDDGELPLHFTCSDGQSSDVIDMLIASNPDGLSVHDKDGFLPFHRACIESENVSTVTHLITKLVGTVLPSTKDGVPALYLACEKGANLDVILTLVRHSQELFPGDMLSGRELTRESRPKKRRKMSS